MERFKSMMMILMEQRDLAKKRQSDLTLQLKITTEKLSTVERDKVEFLKKIGMTDKELEGLYEENSTLKTQNQELEFENDRLIRERDTQQNELDAAEREMQHKEETFTKLEKELEDVDYECKRFGK